VSIIAVVVIQNIQERLNCLALQGKEEREKERQGGMAKVIEMMKKTKSCRFQTSSFLPVFLPSLAESGDDLCVIFSVFVLCL
jgi:hypothetical protein